MPSQKKYNARFPPARIKKIMQTDEEIGKVAAPVPVIISRVLEMFIKNLLDDANARANLSQARTLHSSHLVQSISADHRLKFLQETIKLHYKGGDGEVPNSDSAALDALQDSSADEEAPTPARSCTSATAPIAAGLGYAEISIRNPSMLPATPSSFSLPTTLHAGPSSAVTVQSPVRTTGARGRPRGRPPKRPVPPLHPIGYIEPKRGRGRPRKQPSLTYANNDEVLLGGAAHNLPASAGVLRFGAHSSTAGSPSVDVFSPPHRAPVLQHSGHNHSAPVIFPSLSQGVITNGQSNIYSNPFFQDIAAVNSPPSALNLKKRLSQIDLCAEEDTVSVVGALQNRNEACLSDTDRGASNSNGAAVSSASSTAADGNDSASISTTSLAGGISFTIGTPLPMPVQVQRDSPQNSDEDYDA